MLMENNHLSTKKTINNILKVLFSNILKLFSGILISFLLPKIIGVTDYGYYKTFTLYASYVGLFHFGFIDGIYLKYGDKNIDELDKSSFRFFFSFLVILEILISILVGVVALLGLHGEIRFIFLCLAIFLFANNLLTYYQTISQITNRFNEYSLRTIIQSILISASIVILWLINKYTNLNQSYRLFTCMYVGIFLLLMIWYIFTYRDLSFGKSKRISKREIGKLIKIGIPLLVANLCSTFILNADRQFVSIFFDMDTYAIYAFAYNMLGLGTTALSAISTVIYPLLKRTNDNNLKSIYSKGKIVILILSFACLLFFFPLKAFIFWFLPKYESSLQIFRIILPGLAISSIITIIMHNFYKIEGKEVQFFVKSVLILALSIIANFVAYLIFKTTIAISIASIVVMIAWYLLIEAYFVKKHQMRFIKDFSFLVLMMIIFYLVTIWEIWYASMLLYLFSFVILVFIFYSKDLKTLFLLVRKNK